MRVLATALAILLSTGAAEAHLGAAAPHIAAIARSPSGGAVLGTFPANGDEICHADKIDDADGLRDTRCGERAALAAFVAREAEVARLSVGMDSLSRYALAELRRAERRYATALATHEVERHGTDRADEAQAVAEAQEEAFSSLLRRTVEETGRSVAEDTSTPELDTTLETTLSLVLAEPIGSGSISHADVRQTQAAWLAYRQAFVFLAMNLDLPTERLESELISRRTRDLQGLIAD